MPLTIERIAKVVSDHEPAHYERHADTRWAAVAIILKQSDDHTEALFILRAKHDGDPWSGHMAFPGGHREPADENLRQTAEREILEDKGHIAPGRIVVSNVFPLEYYAPLVRFIQAGDKAQQGRFSGPSRSQHDQEFVCSHHQIYTPERFQPAKALAKSLEFERAGH